MSSIDYDRINFEDLPSNLTPLASRILNRMDKAIDDIVKHINKEEEYTLNSSGWVSISSYEGPYNYKYFISTNIFSDDDIPICQTWGMNDIETQDEITSIGYIKKVMVDSSGITVYASSKPTVNLKLILKV